MNGFDYIVREQNLAVRHPRCMRRKDMVPQLNNLHLFLWYFLPLFDKLFAKWNQRTVIPLEWEFSCSIFRLNQTTITFVLWNAWDMHLAKLAYVKKVFACQIYAFCFSVWVPVPVVQWSVASLPHSNYGGSSPRWKNQSLCDLFDDKLVLACLVCWELKLLPAYCLRNLSNLRMRETSTILHLQIAVVGKSVNSSTSLQE